MANTDKIDKKIVEFSAKAKRKVWGDTPDFRVWSMSVDDKEIDKLNMKRSKYGDVTICGAFQELGDMLEYHIKAEEIFNQKNGYSYKVLNISRNRPNSSLDFKEFLCDILTPLQAESLYTAYPDIIQRVIENKTDDIDFSKIYNIKEERFKSVKQKIVDNYVYAEIVNTFKGTLTLSQVKAIYAKYASVQAVLEALKKDPYRCLCQLSRIGFKTADIMIQDFEKEGILSFDYDLKTSKQRCLACIMHILEDNENNGSTIIDLIELRKLVMKQTPACSQFFVEALKEPEIYYDKDKMIVALRSTYDTEKYIADNIRQRLCCDIKKWDFDILKYRNVNGIQLSDEQMKLLSTVCTSNFVVLTAPGGTGKSFSTKALINMFIDNNITFILASPTGKAAKKLSEYTGENAKTIHRTLCYENGEFVYNKENQLTTDVLLLDEVGMTDIKLFKHLLEALPTNTRIVLVGDQYQLNSVGCGALLRDLISYDKIPQVHYTKVFRMGIGGVLTACTYVRNNKKFITKNELTQIGEDKSYSFIPAKKEDINKMIVALYKKLIATNSPKDITVLSAYNVGDNGCVKLNQLLQPIANPNANPKNEHLSIKQNKETTHFYVGDTIIANVNNYHAKLYNNHSFIYDNDGKPTECMIANGDQGNVIEITDKGLVINFDGTIVYYSYGELQNLKHAFAISTHKMQGSQNKIIIFCCPSSHMFMLSNNIIYTSISRAETTVYHFSDEHTLNTAIKKSDGNRRETLLGTLVKENK